MLDEFKYPWNRAFWFLDNSGDTLFLHNKEMESVIYRSTQSSLFEARLLCRTLCNN